MNSQNFHTSPERQQYLERRIVSVLQKMPVPMTQEGVDWMMQQIGAQGHERGFVMQRMRFHYGISEPTIPTGNFQFQGSVPGGVSQQPQASSDNDQKRRQQRRVVEFYQDRSEEYQKEAARYQREADRYQEEATYQRREIDLRSHEQEARRIRGRSHPISDMGDMQREIFARNNVTDIEMRVLHNQGRASFYEGAANRAKEKIRHYEQLGPEAFTEKFVAQILSEPKEYPKGF